jgi:hypothetical protein
MRRKDSAFSLIECQKMPFILGGAIFYTKNVLEIKNFFF